jgi:hypothetical protein
MVDEPPVRAQRVREREKPRALAARALSARVLSAQVEPAESESFDRRFVFPT